MSEIKNKQIEHKLIKSHALEIGQKHLAIMCEAIQYRIQLNGMKAQAR